MSTNCGCHNIACRICRLLKVHCISHCVHKQTCCFHVSTDPSQSSAVRHPASMTCSHSVVFTAGMHDNVNITCHCWCSVYMYVVLFALICVHVYITWYIVVIACPETPFDAGQPSSMGQKTCSSSEGINTTLKLSFLSCA